MIRDWFICICTTSNYMTTHLQPLHARHLPLWHPLWYALAGVSCTFHLDLVFFRMPLTGDSWQDRLTKSARVTRLLSVITYKRFWLKLCWYWMDCQQSSYNYLSREYLTLGGGNTWVSVTCAIKGQIKTITISSNLIGALTALIFINYYCVRFKSESEIGQLAVIVYLKSDSYFSQSY